MQLKGGSDKTKTWVGNHLGGPSHYYSCTKSRNDKDSYRQNKSTPFFCSKNVKSMMSRKKKKNTHHIADQNEALIYIFFRKIGRHDLKPWQEPRTSLKCTKIFIYNFDQHQKGWKRTDRTVYIMSKV